MSEICDNAANSRPEPVKITRVPSLTWKERTDQLVVPFFDVLSNKLLQSGFSKCFEVGGCDNLRGCKGPEAWGVWGHAPPENVKI